MAEVRDLQQLVERRLKELGGQRGPMSARQAAARSEGRVSYETLRLLLRGQHSGSIERETAEGVALALDVSVETVLRLVGQRIPLGPFVLPKRADTLTPPERAAVLSVVDAILGAASQDRTSADVRAVAGSAEPPGGSRGGARRAGETARRARVRRDDKP